MVEGARLESEYTAKPYRGFESLPLRHVANQPDASTQLDQLYTTSLRAITSLYQAALSFGMRFCVWKST